MANKHIERLIRSGWKLTIQKTDKKDEDDDDLMLFYFSHIDNGSFELNEYDIEDANLMLYDYVMNRVKGD